MTAEEMLKEARKRMYKQLRQSHPYADKQVVKTTAYDLTREAFHNLNAPLEHEIKTEGPGTTWVYDVESGELKAQ